MDILREDVNKFEGKVFPEPMSGCWLWVGGTTRGGYGVFYWSGSKHIRAHRAAYEIYNGPIPEGAHVLHKCDTPGCVNPNHLFVGTHSDNMRDMAKKGRAKVPRPSVQGENSSSSKLSEEDVKSIRKRRRNGEKQAKLANEYSVSKMTISLICRHLRWSNIT